MYKLPIFISLILGQALILAPLHPAPNLAPPDSTESQSINQLENCKDFAWSSEEDFITRATLPPDGDPIISDGDLLGRFGTVCMRNAELLQPFDVPYPMGLDAADVLDVEQVLVAFSTELNSPFGNFEHGDLLTTWGAAIPNQALLVLFQIKGDRGLDAVHFVGELEDIIAFNVRAAEISRDEWLANPGELVTLLEANNVDIWFSIEGTEEPTSPGQLLDGDVLSVVTGTIVVGNDALLPPAVPAGIPTRGVDLGVDALTAQRNLFRDEMRFSTEILHRHQAPFTDGDILKIGNGIVIPDHDLANPFEPWADFVGTDALYIRLDAPTPPPRRPVYMPLVLASHRR